MPQSKPNRAGGKAGQLEESGFVVRGPQFGRDFKDALFKLSDEYSRFYLKWIERHRGRADNAWLVKRSTPGWRAWSGYAFEGICAKHVRQLKRALGVEAVDTSESSWRHLPKNNEDRGAQIDLLIDRADNCINVCEMKFSEAEFVIDKKYAQELRNKLDVFRNVTGTKKTLFLTMVTTHGVRPNAYREELVAKTIEMDALFGS